MWRNQTQEKLAADVTAIHRRYAEADGYNARFRAPRACSRPQCSFGFADGRGTVSLCQQRVFPSEEDTIVSDQASLAIITSKSGGGHHAIVESCRLLLNIPGRTFF